MRNIFGFRAQVARQMSAVAVASVIAFTLSSCDLASVLEKPAPPMATPTYRETANPNVDLRSFYTQKIEWGKCERVEDSNIQCAQIEVPLDYSHPQGEKIKLVIARSVKTGSGKTKVLLLNPGGPGGSGISFLSHAVKRMISKKVQKEFVIASFDPRGVGRSTPVRCLEPKEIDAFRAESADIVSEDSFAKVQSNMRKLGQACQQHTGVLLGHVSTVEAAKDMDIIRAVLGQPKLNYLGYSYGSFLGATYADLFPKNVDKMVLDGVLSSAYNGGQVSESQARGFEESTKEFLRYCINRGKCPLGNTEEKAQANLIAFFNSLKTQPLPTKDKNRKLTESLAYEGFLGSLYNVSLFPYLFEAVTEAVKQKNGTRLLLSADFYAGRETDGTYPENQFDAFIAINALDYPVEGDPQQWKTDSENLKRTCPIVGSVFSYSYILPSVWPVKAAAGNGRTVRHAKEAPPILMIANLHDPATPLDSAKDAAQNMPSAHLITWDSYDHTAYGSGSACIDKAVDKYLVSGELPKAGLACPKSK